MGKCLQPPLPLKKVIKNKFKLNKKEIKSLNNNNNNNNSYYNNRKNKNSQIKSNNSLKNIKKKKNIKKRKKIVIETVNKKVMKMIMLKKWS